MNKKINKILSIGEIIWDVYPDKRVIGGAPLNFAAHASLCGVQSSMLSAVGNDELGEAALDALKEFEVNSSLIKKVNFPTGQCIVSLDENFVPSYNVLKNTAYDNTEVTDEDVAKINAECFDALYFGTLMQRNSVSAKTVRRIANDCAFSEIICDVNLRTDCFDKDSVSFCLSKATVLKISAEEEPTLRTFGLYSPASDDVSNIALALCESFDNLKIVIITLGGDGAYAYDARCGKSYYQEAVKVPLVSTVGAGDSFAAAWLTSFLGGEPIEACMQRAAEISAFVVSHTEAIPKY